VKITDVICHVLLVPEVHAEDTDSAQDDAVVEIHTDEGLVGIGETDTNPWAVRALIESPSTHTMGMGLKEILVGADPLDTEALWDRMYTGTMHYGRRGLGVSAIGALDMALWDLKGKALGEPCWKLLGGARQEAVRPYASLQPRGRSLEQYCDSLSEWVVKAKDFGFAAAKLEATLTGPYAHSGLDEPEEATVDVVAACREAAGPDFVLMVDVQYAWSNARQAGAPRSVLRRDAASDRRPGRLCLPARSSGDTHRRGGMADHPLRVPRSHGPRQGRCGPAGRGPGRGADRGQEDLRLCGRSRPADRAALLEDGHRHLRLRPHGGHRPQLPLRRIPAGGALPVRPEKGAGLRGAPHEARRDSPSREAGPGNRVEPRRAGALRMA